MSEGRRQRVKERAREEGIDHFEPHELLELMLYPYVLRKDTKPIAVELLNIFGSLDGVLNATERDLLSIKGMTKEAAFHFSFYYRITARAKSEGIDKNRVLLNYEEAGKYVCERIGHLNHEEFLVICLDSKKRIVRTKIFTHTDPAKAEINMRMIADTILGAKCVAVIVAHNHPSGELTPSGEDINATKQLYKLLDSLGIKLYDHIIVNRTGSFSFNKANLMKSISATANLRIAEKE
ncbi:MAG: JAB domain-containing protein [Clostridia bacterium]|nr:JAB domain-containing protein [Clostridia bacterium]